MWWKQRRREIVEDMEREVYGRLPKKLPKVTWTVTVTDREMVGRIPVIAKQLVGRVDNSEYPLIDVNISMTLVVPENRKGPVPVLMMFGRAVLPAPAQPPQEDLERINAKLRALLMRDDPALQAILERYRSRRRLWFHSAAEAGRDLRRVILLRRSNCSLPDGVTQPSIRPAFRRTMARG